MHRMYSRDNLILTPAEQRALEVAKQRHYVVYEGRLRRHGKLEQAFANWCHAQGKPFIEVGIKGQYAFIRAEPYFPQWLPSVVRDEIEALGKRETATRGRHIVAADVCCRLEKIPVARVEAVA